MDYTQDILEHIRKILPAFRREARMAGGQYKWGARWQHGKVTPRGTAVIYLDSVFVALRDVVDMPHQGHEDWSFLINLRYMNDLPHYPATLFPLESFLPDADLRTLRNAFATRLANKYIVRKFPHLIHRPLKGLHRWLGLYHNGKSYRTGDIVAYKNAVWVGDDPRGIPGVEDTGWNMLDHVQIGSAGYPFSNKDPGEDTLVLCDLGNGDYGYDSSVPCGTLDNDETPYGLFIHHVIANGDTICIGYGVDGDEQVEWFTEMVVWMEPYGDVTLTWNGTEYCGTAVGVGSWFGGRVPFNREITIKYPDILDDPITLADDWTRLGESTFQYETGATQYPNMKIPGMVVDDVVQFSGAVTEFEGSALKLTVRNGYNFPDDFFDITAMGDFSATGIAGGDLYGMMIITNDNARHDFVKYHVTELITGKDVLETANPIEDSERWSLNVGTDPSMLSIENGVVTQYNNSGNEQSIKIGNFNVLNAEISYTAVFKSPSGTPSFQACLRMVDHLNFLGVRTYNGLFEVYDRLAGGFSKKLTVAQPEGESQVKLRVVDGVVTFTLNGVEHAAGTCRITEPGSVGYVLRQWAGGTQEVAKDYDVNLNVFPEGHYDLTPAAYAANAGYVRNGIGSRISHPFLGDATIIEIASFGENWVRLLLGDDGAETLPERPTIQFPDSPHGDELLLTDMSGSGYSYGGNYPDIQQYLTDNIDVPIRVIIS